MDFALVSLKEVWDVSLICLEISDDIGGESGDTGGVDNGGGDGVDGTSDVDAAVELVGCDDEDEMSFDNGGMINYTYIK